MLISYFERLVRKYFTFFLSLEKVFYNYKPRWLFNNETGGQCELDIYFPDLKFAVEVNGFTHLTEYQKKIDEFKKSRCKREGITLLTLNSPRDLLKESVRNHLKIKLNRNFPLELIPYSFINRLSHYRYNKKKWEKIAKIAKKKRSYKKAFTVQHQEKAFLIRRAEIRKKLGVK